MNDLRSWADAQVKGLGWTWEMLSSYLDTTPAALTHALATGDLQTVSQVALLLGSDHHPPGVWGTVNGCVPGPGEFALHGRTLGKVLGVGAPAPANAGHVGFEVFGSPGHCSVREVREKDLRRVRLSSGTRAFVETPEGEWRIGRVARHEAASVEVHYPQKEGGYVDESAVHVRAAEGGLVCDPAVLLGERVHDTALFGPVRSAFVQALAEQRRYSGGLDAMVAARVDVLPHQFEAVRRVLEDPMPRYVLADEVGLGKTIEACALIRQHLSDEHSAVVWVVVPAPLVAQWQTEWSTRFAVRPRDPRVQVVTFEELPTLAGAPTLLVVDEAHRATEDPASPVYGAVLRAARAAPSVLLLTATPAALERTAYLGLLHLLAPTVYPLDDFDAFSARVDMQQTLGRSLMQLDASHPRFVLMTALEDLMRQVPSDPRVADCAARLKAGTDFLLSPDDAESVMDLRAYVGETYRLHQRLLRARRATSGALAWPRSDDRVYEEYGADGRESDVADALETWRLETLEWAEGPAVYAALVSVGGRSLHLLGEAVHARLGSGPWPETLLHWERTALGVPAYGPGEAATLGAIAGAAEAPLFEGDLDRIALAAQAITGRMKDGSRVVAFVSDAASAEALGERLAAAPGTVYRHLATCLPEARVAAVAHFCTSTDGACLIGDQSAEEGLNLHAADAIVHVDMPLDVARIEQRTGRLDRIGRQHPFDQVILVGPEHDASPWDAWARIVRLAYGVFRESATALLPFLERHLRDVFATLHADGPYALLDGDAMVTRFADAAQSARVEIEEQDALNNLLVRASDTQGVVGDLAALESGDSPKNLSNAAARVLSFMYGATLAKVAGGWTYRFTTIPLLPFDQFLHCLLPWHGKALTSDRTVSQKTGANLLRAGHPLVQHLDRLSMWDDRGQAWAAWRHAPGLEASTGAELWWGFEATVIAEPDIVPALQVLDAHGRRTPAAVSSVRRRAHSAMGPTVFRYVLDAHLDPAPTAVADVLKKPYSKDFDVSLHRDRAELLSALLPPHQWREVCTGASATAQERATSEFSEQAEQAAQRLQKRHLAAQAIRSARASGVGADDAESDAFERALDAAIVEGVERPCTRLDALGAWVLTEQHPSKSTSF